MLVKVDESAGESRFAHLLGSAGPGLTTDEVMAMTRGDPADDTRCQRIFGCVHARSRLVDMVARDARGCGSPRDIFVNEVIYAELSVRFATIDLLDAKLAEATATFVAISKSALFLSGKTFPRYRQRGGPRISILPDFFIGAHAESEGWRLLTRDPRRYRTYFPAVRLITPDP